jgi:hypothetical protein
MSTQHKRPTAAPALVAKQQTLANKQVGKIHEQKVIGRMVLVTPVLAAHILEKNDMNRTIRQDHVDKMARDMIGGKWNPRTAPPCLFAKDGTCMDGQHRFYAVLMSGVSVMMEFREGLDKSEMTTIDVGRARTFQDVLRIDGRSEISELATAARYWYNFLNRQVTVGRAISHSELIDLLNRNPKIAEHVAEANKYKRARSLLSPGMWAFIYSAAAMTDSDKARAFAEQFDSGQDLKKGNPALTLREKAAQNRATRSRLRPIVLVAYAIKAWNAYLTGRQLSILKWQDGEQFPTFTRLTGVK